MTSFTPAATLAWRIGAFEALQAHAEFIEKEHLLIGLFSLEKALSQKDCAKDPGAARTVLQEKDALDYLLRTHRQDATALRRGLRHVLVHGSAARKPGTMHRSAACRQSFARAAHLAGGRAVSSVHLFHAILEEPGPVIRGVLDRDTVQAVAGGEAGCLTLQMTRSVREYEEAEERKEQLHSGIEDSRHALATLTRGSDAYRRLMQELFAKTIFLARTCLDHGDSAGLVFALRGLAGAAGECRDQLHTVIAQAEYLGVEGISMGETSKKQVRDLLARLEQQGPGGTA